MKCDPVEYFPFERNPIGCFSAEMTAGGWANTKFDHSLQEHLLSDEVSEFIHLVYHFFKENADWQKLQKFAGKHGTEINGDDYSTILAFNYEGEIMDYIVHVIGTKLQIFPYRKTQHRNLGRYE